MTFDVRTDIRQKLDQTDQDIEILDNQIDQLTRERDALVERRTAYSEVLDLLESGPPEVPSVAA